MADETTQPDTTTSSTETTPNEASSTEQQETTTDTVDDAADGDKSPDTETDDGTALGGKSEEASEEGDKTEATESEGAPEAYDLSIEGLDIDQDLLAEADPVLRELDLTNDQAQTLMPLANKLVENTRDGVMSQLTDAAAQQKKDWLDVAKSDEAIGGANWEASLANSAKALDALGFTEGHPFRAALNETGFGNHRDVIFAFSEFGKLVGEDGDFVRSDAGAPVTSAKDILYGNKEKGSS